MRTPPSSLRLAAIGLAALFGLAGTTAVFAAEGVPPALAAKRAGVASQATPSPLELIYVPVTPCRAFGAQNIPATGTKNFLVAGSASFVFQGGPAAGCGVPLSARSVTMNLTAGNTTYPGFLTAFAVGTPRPGITTLSLQNTNITNSTVVALGAAGNISIYSNKSVNVFGDITGYWVPQLWAYVGAGGSLIDSSGRVVSSVLTGSTGVYNVTFDRDISTCSGTASSDLTGYIMSVYTSGTLAYVYVYNNAGVASNYWFNLHIKC